MSNVFTAQEAAEYAQKSNVTLVSRDSIIAKYPGTASQVILHIVVDNNNAYAVELSRPIWLYGNEGILSEPLEYLGELNEDSLIDSSDLDYITYSQYLPLYNNEKLWEISNDAYGDDGKWQHVATINYNINCYE